MKTDNLIVFLHGAGLGSFIWDEVIGLIKMPSLAIDFPCRNSTKALKLKLEDYVHHVGNEIERQGGQSVFIVAHSIGGMIATEVTYKLGERVKGIIGVGASIPKRGDSFVSSQGFPNHLILPIVLRFLGTSVAPKMLKMDLCSDLNEEKSNVILSSFTPESKALYLSKRVTENLPDKRFYIRLKNDKAYSLKTQNKMISNFKAQKVIDLDCGHLPMLSHTTILAQILKDLIATD